MTPLEAARRLAADFENEIPLTESDSCWFCDVYDSKHKPDCPIPMLPAIVSALEQGERLYKAAQEFVGCIGDGRLHCPTCITVPGHRDGCEYNALRAALHGQEAGDERCQKQDCVNRPGYTGWHSFVLLSEGTRCQEKHKPSGFSKKVNCERPANHTGQHSAHDETFKWEPQSIESSPRGDE